MADTRQMYQERIQVFKDAVKHEKTRRVVNISNFYTWKIYDAGYKLSEALTDYSKMEEVVSKFHEKYQFDFYKDLGTRNPLRIANAVGHTNYILNDETYAINFPDINYMEPEDYDDVTENYYKYLWTKFVPNKYRSLQGPNAKEKIRNGVLELAKFGQYSSHINQFFADKYGVPPLYTGAVVLPFFEILFNALRGIKGLSMDIRERPEKVKAACDAVGLGRSFESYRATAQKGTSTDAAVDIYMALLGHTILSVKQFEMYYWPYLKQLFDFAEEYDKIVYIFAEGHNERFFDFFNEAPKGHVVIHLEMDDIFEAKEKIGDTVCLCGGMPVDLLYQGTPEENVAYAKRLIDELAADGGFIFSQNKMVSFVNDCKAENLKAVNDFVREYTL